MLAICDTIHKFLAKYPFASPKIISWHFGLSASIVKEILIFQLGFKTYTPSRISHLPDAAQRKHRRLSAGEPLKLSRECELFDFNNITTRDAFWFRHHCEPRKVFESSQARC
jgi:SET domain-containing protein